MRKNGMALLQSFVEGPVLMAPEHVGSLRVLAEAYADPGRLNALVSSIATGLGLSTGRVREDLAITHNHDSLCETYGMGASDRSKPFAFAEGVAVIPVWGSLLHRDNYSDSYATGYDYIRNKFSLAMADPDVKGIVFDVNSNGGHVMGNFELADMIYEGRARKPSLAVVDGNAYSGGYSLASAASRMVTIPSAGVGSIGVVMMHASVEGLLAKNGVEVSLIYAGANKVDSYPFRNLSDSARERFQASVDKSYNNFVSLVERNRGMSADAVRATEASCYDAEQALSLGLIDAIQSPAVALAAFRQGLNGSNTTPGVKKMDNENNKAGDGADAATTGAEAAAAPPTADAATTPTVVDQKARIKAITSCEDAAGREALASHLAFDTDMSAEAAQKVLAAAPKADAKASNGDAFAAAMDSTANPNVGSGGESAANGGGSEPSGADRMLSAWSSATGNKLKK
jgi:signal peptide peptidase SppA